MRSALAMGADDRRLFAKVILPGALPYILTGLRLGLAQAWRIWSVWRCWRPCRGASAG